MKMSLKELKQIIREVAVPPMLISYKKLRVEDDPSSLDGTKLVGEFPGPLTSADYRRNINVKEPDGSITSYVRDGSRARWNSNTDVHTYYMGETPARGKKGQKLEMIGLAAGETEYEDKDTMVAKLEVELAKTMVNHWDEINEMFPGLDEFLKSFKNK